MFEKHTKVFLMLQTSKYAFEIYNQFGGKKKTDTKKFHSILINDT